MKQKASTRAVLIRRWSVALLALFMLGASSAAYVRGANAAVAEERDEEEESPLSNVAKEYRGTVAGRAAQMRTAVTVRAPVRANRRLPEASLWRSRQGLTLFPAHLVRLLL